MSEAIAGEMQQRSFDSDYFRNLLNTLPYNDTSLLILSHLSRHSQGVDLHWDEDGDIWECTCISSGVRFMGCGYLPRTAIKRCAEAVLAGASMATKGGC